MNTLNTPSLGDQVSRKISTWILVLVTTVILSLVCVSFLLSKQMFNKQVSIWTTVTPQYALTNLIDSDHFSIGREIKFLKSTGLFSSFGITDNQKEDIAHFGSGKISNAKLIPIQDNAKVIWGYYYFTTNFYKFFSSFLVSAALFLILVLIAYFIIRLRIKASLDSEFTRFNEFLNEIETVIEKLHELYNVENDFKIPTKTTHSIEEIIINRAIGTLLKEIQKANKSLRQAIYEAEQRRFREELTRTALQVAHDIGSPLGMLEVIIQSSSFSLPEESRTSIRQIIGRIRDISNSLLQKAKPDIASYDDPLAPQLLYTLLNQVISEKRMQHRHRISIETNFDRFSYTLFALTRGGDFCRVISNIMNNAIEAIEHNGKIIVSLNTSDDNINIHIQDNGKGIKEDVLKNIGKFGRSFGKTEGLGLGLDYAITTIDNWGGNIDIQSQEGQGTTVHISIPKSPTPSWFISEINIYSELTIVIIDDDDTIHAIWKEHLKENLNNVKLIHFYSPEEAIRWKTEKNHADLYLCDYEFIGSQINGIDLIKQLKIKHLSILVTNRISNDVVSNCEIEGIKLLPKELAHIIPVKYSELTHE